MNQHDVFRRRPEVRIKRVGNSVAAFVREQKALHVLNPTARLILEYLEEPASAGELVLMLLEATDGREDAIRADLEDALGSYLEIGLIERVS